MDLAELELELDSMHWNLLLIVVPEEDLEQAFDLAVGALWRLVLPDETNLHIYILIDDAFITLKKGVHVETLQLLLEKLMLEILLKLSLHTRRLLGALALCRSGKALLRQRRRESWRLHRLLFHDFLISLGHRASASIRVLASLCHEVELSRSCLEGCARMVLSRRQILLLLLLLIGWTRILVCVLRRNLLHAAHAAWRSHLLILLLLRRF